MNIELAESVDHDINDMMGTFGHHIGSDSEMDVSLILVERLDDHLRREMEELQRRFLKQS
jgi:hypothetical protein